MKFFNRGGKDRPITPKTIRDVSDDEIEANVSIADEDDLEEFARQKSELLDTGLFGGVWHPSAEISGQWGVVDSDDPNTNSYYYAKSYQDAIKLSEELNKLPEQHTLGDRLEIAKRFR